MTKHIQVCWQLLGNKEKASSECAVGESSFPDGGMGCWAQHPQELGLFHAGGMSGCSLPALGTWTWVPWAGAERVGSSAGCFCQGGAPQTPDSAFDGVITAGV